MDSNLITHWNNLQSILFHYVGIKKISNDILEDEFVLTIVDNFWKQNFIEVIEEKNIDFTIEELKTKINQTFKKVEPTKALAEDYRLPDWLNQSLRVNEQGEKQFDDYKAYLANKGLGGVVNQIDADTYYILNKCHDPRDTSKQWDRRGLVYGHVQSGKTANYVGLINRAFDHGYKIVIVLTGVTEDLRQQTQKRIDKGVIEINRSGKKIFSATTISEDLGRKTESQLIANCSLDDHSIWVIKKNKTVLENLISWLDKQRKTQDSEKIKNTPVLIIDDEADNASIQSLSKREFEQWDEAIDLDFSEEKLSEADQEKLDKARESVIKAINRNIRVVLSLMYNKTFVAYTATPYSIINQSFEDLEREVKIGDKKFIIDSGDLFPRDFIIPIKPGKKYIGVNKLYNSDDNLNLPVHVDLNEDYSDDIEDFFPTKRGHEYFFKKLPQSLNDAIEHFILVIFIKRYRGIVDYNSMLIHTSHLTSKTDYVAVKVEEYCKSLISELRISDSNIVKRFNARLKSIKENSNDILFNRYFELSPKFPNSVSKNDLFNILNGKDFKIVSYHSSKDPALVHKEHSLVYSDEKNAELMNYIVIGGNRLSRGLTLEGLSVSYFVRNSTRKDSLFQMARWFGYRSGYEDLIRIFMPQDQILWYNSIFKLEEGLRRDFEENNNDENPVMPKNAIIRIALETDKDLHLSVSQRRKFPSICDPNKLRKTSEERVKLHGGFYTSKIRFNHKSMQSNFDLSVELFEHLFENYQKNIFDYESLNQNAPGKNSKNISFTNIPSEIIYKFLQKFSFHEDDYEMVTLREYIYKNSSNVNNWSVSIANKRTHKPTSWEISKYFGESTELFLNATTRKPNKDNPKENDTLTFKSILDAGTVDTSFDLIDDDNLNVFLNKPTERIIQPIRNVKKIPLLLLYPVELDKKLLVLLHVFYPFYKKNKSVKYLYKKSYSR